MMYGCLKFLRGFPLNVKRLFESTVFFVYVLQRPDKKNSICSVEGPVNKRIKPLQVFWFCTHNKIIWTVPHQFHQFIGVIDDGHSLSPCNGSSQECGNFNVFFYSESVRNGNGVGTNKIRAVVFIHLFV